VTGSVLVGRAVPGLKALSIYFLCYNLCELLLQTLATVLIILQATRLGTVLVLLGVLLASARVAIASLSAISCSVVELNSLYAAYKRCLRLIVSCIIDCRRLVSTIKVS
jgi:hypothetical protein